MTTKRTSPKFVPAAELAFLQVRSLSVAGVRMEGPTITISGGQILLWAASH